jgi:hypothetical protein
MLKRNIVYSLGGQGLVMVLSLIATRLIFHELGDEVLGIIYFAVTVTFALIVFSDMGISPTISREVAVYRHSEPSYVQDLVRTTSLILWGVYLLSCMAVYWFVPVLSEQWLNLQHTDTRIATQAMQLISFSLLLAIPRALYASVINGHERVDLANIANVAATVLQYRPDRVYIPRCQSSADRLLVCLVLDSGYCPVRVPVHAAHRRSIARPGVSSSRGHAQSRFCLKDVCQLDYRERDDAGG